MSQHTPQGNLISNTTREAIGLLHETADLFVPPVIDSVFHGAAKGVLDWAGAATNQPATSAPSQLGQQSASWPPAAPSQLGQSSASWPPVSTLVTWMPLFQTTCQPTQQASHDLAALWEIVKALVALNKELASRINLLQESVRQLSPRHEYAQANNTSTPSTQPSLNISPAVGNNMQPSLNISPEVGNNTGVLNNAGLGNNSGVISRGEGNVQAAGKTEYGLSHWNMPR